MAKPIFCVTHPRACSTAFERVFMTRTKDLTCFHEPFGEPFYYGPERMSARFEEDEAYRIRRGTIVMKFPNAATLNLANATFFYRSPGPIATTLPRSPTSSHQMNKNSPSVQGKRPFLKDMIYYLMPPNGVPAQIAPSLLPKRRGIGTENGVSHINGSSKATRSPFPYGTEAEADNPTIVPLEMLKRFHYAFLIRDPHSSVPSFFRCTLPPLVEVTEFYEFYPNEAGYAEMRRFLDYLISIKEIGPKVAGQESPKTNGHVNGVNGHANGANGYTNGVIRETNGANGYTNGVNGHVNDDNGHINGVDKHLTNGHINGTNGINGYVNGVKGFPNGVNEHTNGVNGRVNGTNGHVNGVDKHVTNGYMNGAHKLTNGHETKLPVEICLVDADDLLDNPEGIIKEFCRSVGLDYQPSMLDWSSEEARTSAREAFEKWKGWHEDALKSQDFKPRTHKKKVKTEEEWDAEWKAKFGDKAAQVIRQTVDANMPDYLYLKQFAMKV